MAYPINGPYHFGAICSRCGSVLDVSTERSNNQTAVNRIKYHCDNCKFDFIESPMYLMGTYAKYTTREERKAAKSKQKIAEQTPTPAIPPGAGLHGHGNAAQ